MRDAVALLLLLTGCAAAERGPVAAPTPAPPAQGVVAPTPQPAPPRVAEHDDGGVETQDAAVVAVDPLSASAEATTSIGAPSRGRLEGGLPLPEQGTGFVHNDKRPAQARYGTVELLQLIARAAAVVERELPGSTLVVNDLSLPAGGPIAQHGSHQSGRDADLLFFVLDAQRKPLRSVGVPLDPKGKGWDFKDLTIARDDQRVQLDAPRTWRFVQALLQDGGGAVQRIFIAEHLRTLLLAQALKARAPAAVRARFEDVTCQPESPHDDHMHVRVFCSEGDIARGCEDSAPIFPWQRQALAALGVSPVLARQGRGAQEQRDRAARVTTPAQARKNAGRMHPRVTAFLAAREAWLPKPHPGRRYCR